MFTRPAETRDDTVMAVDGGEPLAAGAGASDDPPTADTNGREDKDEDKDNEDDDDNENPRESANEETDQVSECACQL